MRHESTYAAAPSKTRRLASVETLTQAEKLDRVSRQLEVGIAPEVVEKCESRKNLTVDFTGYVAWRLDAADGLSIGEIKRTKGYAAFKKEARQLDYRPDIGPLPAEGAGIYAIIYYRDFYPEKER